MGACVYLEVDPAAVPAMRRWVAETALALATAALGLPAERPLHIRYFREVHTATEKGTALLGALARTLDPTDQAGGYQHADGLTSAHPLAGMTYFWKDGAIWVNVDQRPRDLAETVLHECRHVWQRQADVWPWSAAASAEGATAAAEADAYTWAAEQMALAAAAAKRR